MGGQYGEIKTLTAVMPSGAATASGFFPGGYQRMNILVPVLTSAWLSLAGENTGAAIAPFVNAAGVPLSGFTPGGTGGVWVDSQAPWLLAAQGYNGIVKISAGAAQGADRSFVINLKG